MIVLECTETEPHATKNIGTQDDENSQTSKGSDKQQISHGASKTSGSSHNAPESHSQKVTHGTEQRRHSKDSPTHDGDTHDRDTHDHTKRRLLNTERTGDSSGGYQFFIQYVTISLISIAMCYVVSQSLFLWFNNH